MKLHIATLVCTGSKKSWISSDFIRYGHAVLGVGHSVLTLAADLLFPAGKSKTFRWNDWPVGRLAGWVAYNREKMRVKTSEVRIEVRQQRS